MNLMTKILQGITKRIYTPTYTKKEEGGRGRK